MKRAVTTGVSFGLTSGTITTLGLIVGLHAGTHSRLAVIGGILTIAVADALSDALGMHIAEESRADLGGLKSVLLRGSEWTATVGWLPDEETGKFIVNYGVGAVEK